MDGLSNNPINPPLFQLRQKLLVTGSLLPSGRSNPESSFKDLSPPPLDNGKIECLLNSTIKLFETSEVRVHKTLLDNSKQLLDHLPNKSRKLRSVYWYHSQPAHTRVMVDVLIIMIKTLLCTAIFCALMYLSSFMFEDKSQR